MGAQAQTSKASKRAVAGRQAVSPMQEKNLKKHVAAIHTDGQLSLLQRKLSNVLLLNAYDHLLTENEHEIDEKTLCTMIGYDSNDRAPLKRALKALAAVQAEWNLLDDEGDEVEWGVASLLSHAVLRKGLCRYGYAPALAEKLYNPAIYASINMKVQRRFRSGHALALYENCYRFKNVGSTGWLPLQTFRKLLGVDESDYYKAFKHLNAKIIKPVTREINAHSDIEITPEFKKRGRSVSEIKFIIKPNKQMPLLDIDDDDSVKGTIVYKRLMVLGISHKLAQQWIVTHGEDYVREKLDYASGQNQKGKLRGSVSGFLTAAITDDYKPKGAVDQKSKKEAAARKAKAKREKAVALEQVKNSKREEAARTKAARAWFDDQSKADQKEILSRFEASLDKDHLRADFSKSKLDSPLIGIRFARFRDAFVISDA